GLALLGVLAGSMGGYFVGRLTPPDSASNLPAGPSSDPPLVSLERTSADEPAFIGVILAEESVDIRPRTDARVAMVHVRLGDRVRRGELLITLDLRKLKKDLNIAEAQLAAARADRQKIALDLEKARERKARRAPLQGTNALSREELENVRYEERLAETQL